MNADADVPPAVLTDDVSGDEVRELLVDSYCALAPGKLRKAVTGSTNDADDPSIVNPD